MLLEALAKFEEESSADIEKTAPCTQVIIFPNNDFSHHT
jgi:hypothetical protein